MKVLDVNTCVDVSEKDLLNQRSFEPMRLRFVKVIIVLVCSSKKFLLATTLSEWSEKGCRLLIARRPKDTSEQ
jgi:hypothetical protein